MQKKYGLLMALSLAMVGQATFAAKKGQQQAAPEAVQSSVDKLNSIVAQVNALDQTNLSQASKDALKVLQASLTKDIAGAATTPAATTPAATTPAVASSTWAKTESIINKFFEVKKAYDLAWQEKESTADTRYPTRQSLEKDFDNWLNGMTKTSPDLQKSKDRIAAIVNGLNAEIVAEKKNFTFIETPKYKGLISTRNRFDAALTKLNALK